MKKLKTEVIQKSFPERNVSRYLYFCIPKALSSNPDSFTNSSIYNNLFPLHSVITNLRKNSLQITRFFSY